MITTCNRITASSWSRSANSSSRLVSSCVVNIVRPHNALTAPDSTGPKSTAGLHTLSRQQDPINLHKYRNFIDQRRQPSDRFIHTSKKRITTTVTTSTSSTTTKTMTTEPTPKPKPDIKTMYDNKTFTSNSNTANGEVSSQTRFHYHQSGNIVWAEYAGGAIIRGSLIATIRDMKPASADAADANNTVGVLDMRYHHVNQDGQLMTGRCVSKPEVLNDGRLRMHEKWTWTSGDCSSGESVVEEVSDA